LPSAEKSMHGAQRRAAACCMPSSQASSFFSCRSRPDNRRARRLLAFK
jgi:hypothetical protein